MTVCMQTYWLLFYICVQNAVVCCISNAYTEITIHLNYKPIIITKWAVDRNSCVSDHLDLTQEIIQ